MSLDDDLAGAVLTSGLTNDQLAELIEVGEEVVFVADEVLFLEGEPAESLWVLLEGQLRMTRTSGTETVVIGIMSTPGQWAGGLQAWGDGDEGAGYRATGTGTGGGGRVLRVPSEELGRLVGEWFPFGKHLIRGIWGTVRGIEAGARERDSLIKLGTLAAGLAHEINNPAAASLRAVESLRVTASSLLSSLAGMAQLGITAEQYVELEARRLEADRSTPLEAGALAAADREEAIGSWLSARGVARAWQLAPTIAAAGVDVPWCERVEATVGAAALGPATEWLAGTVACSTLLDEMHDTTVRISNLVGAVKSYSQMDRASVQEVDVCEGIDSTLVMLSPKLKGIDVQRSYDPDLPVVAVYAGELNQVWTNLIDNAADAMDGAGTLTITTRVNGPDLVVDIADTGGGMPAEVQARAFEPFFTTKDVGRGTGLGLDISRRIISERHHGAISFDSSPAGTIAHVRIPLDGVG